MRRGHWLLPETPDVIGLLRRQLEVTLDGLDAFAAWAAGEPAAAREVRDAERRGDVARRELLSALRAAFVTALEPEDLFALSREVDRILNGARDVVSESQAMACPPDARIAQMASLLGGAVRQLDAAIAELGSNADAATAAADAAIAAERQLEHAYLGGMAALVEVGEGGEPVARRELYRGCSRIGVAVVDAAERVVYAVMKQS